ncbi:MAG: B12-binding domain-containing radical SAM protein [Phycisphaerae bacterium]|nr:B12-binding domain-containing radical SAM protein [Phycisphaerae bacterium]
MNNTPSILLVNPPIYDFSAYDFWLKPLGMLTAAGRIADGADSFDCDQDRFEIFDFLDRGHQFYSDKPQFKSDEWGRGEFFSIKIPKPQVFKNIPRYYRRFGLPGEIFTDFLQTHKPADFAFVQAVMTYWYLGYEEVIKGLKKYWPGTKIVLGGPYCMICPEHAEKLGADFVFCDGAMDKGITNPQHKVGGFRIQPRWDVYERIETAAMKITRGCPFKCTYCTVPLFCDGFTAKPIEQAIEELKFIVSLGVKNIAFYDDSLLYKSDEVLKPFLRYVIEDKIKINFHTPNALNARFIDSEVAELMVKAGFKSFYLGFESRAGQFQRQTGAKVFDDELAGAVKTLAGAGANLNSITAYLMFGHPRFEIQEVEDSLKFVNSLGIRIMLSEFSPIPGTADGKLCEKYIDMNEPLLHNKTAFPIILFGTEKVNRIKEMCHRLNHSV